MAKKKTEKSNVNKNMNFMEIIEKKPEAFEILFERGMHCVGCGLATMETLEQGALVHGINPDELVDELNKTASKKVKSKKKIKKANKKTKSKKRKK